MNEDKNYTYRRILRILASTLIVFAFAFLVPCSVNAADTGLPDDFIADPDLNRDLNLNKHGVPVHQFKNVFEDELVSVPDISVVVEDEYAEEWDDPYVTAPDGIPFVVYNCTTQSTEQIVTTSGGMLSGLRLKRSHAYMFISDDDRYIIRHLYTYHDSSGKSISGQSFMSYIWCLKAGDEGVNADGVYDYKTKYDDEDYLTPLNEIILGYSGSGFRNPRLCTVSLPATSGGTPVSGVKFTFTSDEELPISAVSDSEGIVTAELKEDMDYTVHVDDETYGINVFALTIKDKSEHKGLNEETNMPYISGRYTYDHTCCQGANEFKLVSKEFAEVYQKGKVSSLRTYDGKTPIAVVTGMDFKTLLLLVRNRDMQAPESLSGKNLEVFDLTLVNPHRWEFCDITDVDFTVDYHLSKACKVLNLYRETEEGLVSIDFTQNEQNIEFKLSDFPSGKIIAEYGDPLKPAVEPTVKPDTKPVKISPKATSITKLKAGKKSLTVTWKKQTSQVTGYKIQYSLKKNFKSAKTITIKSNKTTKKVIKKLRKRKRYYVRVRTYKKSGSKTYYSKWSKAKSVKVK